MCRVTIQIPNEVLFDTHMQTKDAAAFSKQMVAIGYYVHNHVSIGYCAQIAGMTEEEFMIFLGRNNIDVFCFDGEEELMRDIANAWSDSPEQKSRMAPAIRSQKVIDSTINFEYDNSDLRNWITKYHSHSTGIVLTGMVVDFYPAGLHIVVRFLWAMPIKCP